MSTRSRDVFPLRFKNATTRDALRHLAEQTGMSMTDIAERAIEHEVVLLAADVETRLEEALAVIRSYSVTRDAQSYIDAAAAGEASGLDPFSRVRPASPASVEVRAEILAEDRFGVIASFSMD